MEKFMILCCLLVASTSVMAQVYKCKDTKGNLEYQESPCKTDSQETLKIQKAGQSERHWAAKLNQELEALRKKTEIDKVTREREHKLWVKQWEADAPKRKLEKEKKDKTDAQKFDKTQADNLYSLKLCLNEGCSTGVYRSVLRDMFKFQVEDTIGNCRNQSIGSTTFLYCTVKLQDAGSLRRARLQMKIGYPLNIPDLIRRGERITDINVY